MDVAPTEIVYDIGAYAQLDARLHADPESYLDRYFTQRFYASPISAKRKHGETEADAAGDDETNKECATIPREWQYVRMAPNKLCVIGLAHRHPLLDPAQQEYAGAVVRVEFADNVRNSVIKGKGKKQSLRVQPDTKLCTIHTENQQAYVIRAAVKGTLMEWNTRLEEDPGLVTRCPSEGFLAVIRPPIDDNNKIFSECVTSLDS